MKKNCLCVFLKHPRFGEVKTRLAATIGDETALVIYTNLCRIIFEQCSYILQEGTIDVFLYCSKKEDVDLVRQWTDNKFYYDYQIGNDLGEKLRNAFEELTKIGYEKITVIGTDTPQLSYQNINEAFDTLNRCDCVVGESYDGGYYLLGTTKFTPFLFENIDWSTEKVFTQTIRNIKQILLTYSVMPALYDIDTEDDLHSLKNIEPALYERIMSYLA